MNLNLVWLAIFFFFVSCGITKSNDFNNDMPVMNEKYISLENAYNFRDLGGISSGVAETVYGKVFRSDELSLLSENDLKKLESMSLRTVVDFRSKEEASNSPDRLIASVKDYISLAISPGNITDNAEFDISQLSYEKSDSIMKSVYRQLVDDPACRDQYRSFFVLLQDEERLPLVFHCTAGKDRTGFGSYLFLSALGVNEEVAMQDYLLSNQYIVNKYKDYLTQYPFLEPLLTVREEYLRESIGLINDKYGNVTNFLVNELEVDTDRLRKIYLK